MLKILKAMSEVNLDGFNPQMGEVSEGETVIGELNDDLKRMLFLMSSANDEQEELNVELLNDIKHHEQQHVNSDCNDKDCKEFIRSLREKTNALSEKVDSTTSMFWAAVKFEFDYPDGNLCIRDGFKVVSEPSDPSGGMSIGFVGTFPMDLDFEDLLASMP